MSNSHGQRDLRIDLVRGVALLVLVTDHLPGNPLRKLTPVAWGLADMAEAFLLLSGVVFGFGLSKHRTNWERIVRCIKRIVTIYCAYVVTAFLLLLLVREFHLGVVAKTLPPHLLAAPWDHLPFDLITLNGRVTHLCILLLYFWFALGICCLPDRVWKYPLRVICCSFLLYLATQFFPEVSLPNRLQTATNYNPFAWQFLFVIGALYTSTNDQRLQKFFLHPIVLPLAFIVQGSLLLCAGMEFDWSGFLTQKNRLGPLRLLHALSAAVILKAILPVHFTSFWQRLLKPIFKCSDQSLSVYCGGTLLVVGLSEWMWTTESAVQIVLINVLVWSGCLCIAMLAAKVKSWSINIRRSRIGSQQTDSE